MSGDQADRFHVGDRVRISRGVFRGQYGEISAVYSGNNRVEVITEIRSHPTPAELDPQDIEPLTPNP